MAQLTLERKPKEKVEARADQKPEHWKYWEQRSFSQKNKDSTIVLFGGLTFKHERLLRGALKALGYTAEIVPTPTVEDFQTGKEYGNYGQCNPTYFTVGNLVNHLRRLERQGQTREQIVGKYIFLTATSPCGPCRFGMYQNEYRLATDNAGFGGFRVLTFGQSPKVDGREDENSRYFSVNEDVAAAIYFSLLIGDLINEMAYAVRPFEVIPGETDRVVDKSLDHIESVIATLKPKTLEEISGTWDLLSRFMPVNKRTVEIIVKVLRFLNGDYMKTVTGNLAQVKAWFDEIDVDRTRQRPVVKITGEFWAQTTEGDGNFEMFKFLEGEGAQVLVEPVATWIGYMFYAAKMKAEDESGLIEKSELDTGRWDRLKARIRRRIDIRKMDLVMSQFTRFYDRLRAALGDVPHKLVDQKTLRDLGHEFYHGRAQGGEGYLEVGKNIYYHQKKLCHMVLSLKPFGCMPSTQSDGAQAGVLGKYGDMIFLPVETSGEGKVNALSRVQMALGEAKRKSKREFQLALEETGLELEQIRAYLDDHPEMKKISYHVPQKEGVIGVAANLAYHVQSRMNG